MLVILNYTLLSYCYKLCCSIQCVLSEGAVVHLFAKDTGAYLHLGDDGTLTAKDSCTNKRSETVCVCLCLG